MHYYSVKLHVPTFYMQTCEFYYIPDTEILIGLLNYSFILHMTNCICVKGLIVERARHTAIFPPLYTHARTHARTRARTHTHARTLYLSSSPSSMALQPISLSNLGLLYALPPELV
jgi:hypothetical protein